MTRQPRTGSLFVFPSPRDPAKPQSRDRDLWRRALQEAWVEDVHLYNLRLPLATQTVMNIVPVPVVPRLLGHSRVSMTLRYAHLATARSRPRGNGSGSISARNWACRIRGSGSPAGQDGSGLPVGA
ncbi:MAG: tyrosine-type recombinase/integrase [Alphaproteobacteria bacterium]|nr:tyrosine-type recombinase/integrase [Alphaproteobacteria bacterium]